MQDNISFSKRGVFRGLHFQNNNYAQTKAPQVLDGIIIDIVVDIRHNSPTFGNFIKYKLDSKKRECIFIDKGFAHGFLTLSETALIMYKVDNYYSKKDSHALDYLDPELNLNLKKHIKNKILVSDQDKKLFKFKRCFFNENKMNTILLLGSSGQLGSELSKNLIC